MKTPKSLLQTVRSFGLIKWPPYFPQLLSAGDGRERQERRLLGDLKASALYHLGHVVPSRPSNPLQDAIQVGYRRRRLTGDYAEFGVFSGRSTIRAYYYMKAACHAGTEPRILAFDSFQGLPALENADQVRYTDFEAGSYACTEEQYRKNVTEHGVPADRIVAIPGWFADTCNDTTAARIGLGKIAIAHIDCDILSATLTVLRFLATHLEDGGLIVFDDWGSYRGHPELGQQGALARFRAERPDLHLTAERIDPGGSAFISLHRKLTAAERAKIDEDLA